MEWLVLLMLHVLVPADAPMQVTLNKTLAQVIQEKISCRRKFSEARQEFEQANAIEDPLERLNAIDRLRRTVLLRCGVRP